MLRRWCGQNPSDRVDFSVEMRTPLQPPAWLRRRFFAGSKAISIQFIECTPITLVKAEP